jgi:hypothetical protein
MENIENQDGKEIIGIGEIWKGSLGMTRDRVQMHNKIA